MTTAVGGIASQVAALVVRGAGQPPAGSSQVAALIVYGPPQARMARDSQVAALVPYEIGKFTVPRTSQIAALIVYGTGVPDQSRARCWSFDLDGHTFYVLDLGPEGTFLYDKTTQQWCKFVTDGYGQWNMANGTMWGQNRIIGGDLITSQLWELNPVAVLDEGWRDLVHVVTGGLLWRTRVYVAQDALRLTGSVGQLDEVNGSVMRMRFSDNQGKSWSDYYDVALTVDSFDDEIAWRSLGSFMAPGRTFEISDQGGIIRIDGVDAFINGFDDEKQSQEV